MAQLTARRMHGGEETESNRALPAMEEASNSRLNMWVSNMHESSFWEIDDTERRESMCSTLSEGTAELKSATANRGEDLSVECILQVHVGIVSKDPIPSPPY